MLVKSWLVLWLVGLITVTTASANGAWILWEHSSFTITILGQSGQETQTWEPLDAFLTRTTCLEGMAAVWAQTFTESLWAITGMDEVTRKFSPCPWPAAVQVKKTPSTSFTITSCDGVFQHTFRCFPDTLDPRTRP
jgi:hypothetical protein